MLEIRNLTKIYKSKGGVEVKALDNVSIVFPPKGLVFLLGKSGSGKSTLLNVTGGLDRPNDGEIIIKGRNSKSFSSSDFDSYRNTFIGFVFQEYNILNEFNVEQNISLALQLQGKKNDHEAVEKILEQVDLKGYGGRKPNTLSGGQKQRIAIARALIKNPEIIMADEPTGALDSTTGKQVFDTLKKLSNDKLVIGVSHYRDFAEQYGDRIIELSDGKIISDVTKNLVKPQVITNNLEIINDNVISIKNAKNITEKEVEEIYSLLKETDGEVLISRGEKQIPMIKQVSHISENQSVVFNKTKEEASISYDGSKTKFIKSRLPYKRAFKMGASSIATKPIRMLFTVFLTLVALTMFGVASTLLFYDPNYSLASGLANSVNDYEAIYKEYDYIRGRITIDNSTYEEIESPNDYQFENKAQGRISEDEINNLNNNSIGHYYVGIYGYSSQKLQFSKEKLQSTQYNITGLNGFIDESLSSLSKSNITLFSGSEPSSISEMAISKYVADALIEGNDHINSYEDIVDKEFEIYFYTNSSSYNGKIKISGIYNCGEIPNKYQGITNSSSNEEKEEYSNYLKYSYHLYAYVNKEFYDVYDFKNSSNRYVSITSTEGTGGRFSEYRNDIPTINDYFLFLSPEISKKSISSIKFYDLNGNEIPYKAPKDNEVYLSSWEYMNTKNNSTSIYMNRVFKMYEASGYSKSFAEFIAIDANKKRIEDIKKNIEEYGTNGYSDYLNDLNFIDKVYTEYYLDWFYHYYLADKLMLAFEEIDQENMYSEIPDYFNVKDKVRNYVENQNNSRNDEYFIEHVEKIYNSYKEKINKYLSLSYAYQISRYMKESTEGFSKDIPLEVAEEYKDLYLKGYNREALTENEINQIINIGRKYIVSTYYERYSDFTIEDKNEQTYRLKNLQFVSYFNTPTESVELNVIGYISVSSRFISAEFIKKYATLSDVTQLDYEETNYSDSPDAKYDLVITRTNYDEGQVKHLLQEYDTYRYRMTNYVYSTVQMIVSTISVMKLIFLITGIVFAVFAALMLFNFISSSISAKTKEIGILRAIGARGSDLFKIFFSESGIIATICFVIAIIGSYFICMAININLTRGLGIKLLNFGVINMALIIIGSLIIAVIGTFIPVFIASKKAPIESIRTL